MSDLVGRIKEDVGEDTAKRVLSDPVLMYRATKFFNERLCHSCKNRTLYKIGRGKKFNRLWLCAKCDEIYCVEFGGR